MSDAIIEDGPSHYYYIGRDRFDFAAGAATSPVEDQLGDPDAAEEAGVGQSAVRIIDAFGASLTGTAAGTVSMAASVNTFCRGLLELLERRSASGIPGAGGFDFAMQQELPSAEPESFPRGHRIPADTWQKLLDAASGILRDHGCLITQRDKRYLSYSTGVEVTPYIWSTLTELLNLKRVKSPYSPASLAIYAPAQRERSIGNAR